MVERGPGYRLFRGDCLVLLKRLPDACIDSLVTDPPAAIGFMDKSWDKDKGGRDGWVAWLAGVMREVYRVLKPGAHGLVWALPRTSHWTGSALEEAGFEVRDCVQHLFGSGFPKSMDVSKAIDKQTRKNAPSGLVSLGREVSSVTRTLTVPASHAAQLWQGWGTALKPAAEFWWLVRKPLVGTVANNVLTHGTGALNIDGCRIGTDDNLSGGAYAKQGSVRHDGTENWRYKQGGAGEYKAPSGRWPAHLVLSHSPHCTKHVCSLDCPVVLLDQQSGSSVSRKGRPRQGKAGDGWGCTHTGAEYNDAGGASRFFYCAKPSRKERDEGLEHLAVKTGAQRSGRKEGSAGVGPRSGAQGSAANFHPTVKSIKLMRWLIRLITPPGGLVLDPFAGSGSTGVAALHEGFRFIGVEAERDYWPILCGRMRRAAGVPVMVRRIRKVPVMVRRIRKVMDDG